MFYFLFHRWPFVRRGHTHTRRITTYLKRIVQTHNRVKSLTIYFGLCQRLSDNGTLENAGRLALFQTHIQSNSLTCALSNSQVIIPCPSQANILVHSHVIDCSCRISDESAIYWQCCRLICADSENCLRKGFRLASFPDTRNQLQNELNSVPITSVERNTHSHTHICIYVCKCVLTWTISQPITS